jgi:predicted metalloprotease
MAGTNLPIDRRSPMRWRGGRRSGNIIDRRGSGGGGLGGLGRTRLRLPGGLGGPGGLPGGIPIGRGGGIRKILLLVVVLVVISLLYERFAGPPADAPMGEQAIPGEQTEMVEFVSVVLADTEDVWNAIFAAEGGDYVEPQLVLFTGGAESACGFAQSAVGPFYCPGDRRVYLDLSFFDSLEQRLGAGGDFAQAYVIAHEIGHHVQNLLGILPEANRRQQALPEAEANAISVQVELQADCFAGVWAHHADAERQVLEPGDIDEALNAASAVGDDQLQRESQGRVVPDSFTHGTSRQRMEWFRTGFDSGAMRDCNTFAN